MNRLLTLILWVTSQGLWACSSDTSTAITNNSSTGSDVFLALSDSGGKPDVVAPVDVISTPLDTQIADVVSAPTDLDESTGRNDVQVVDLADTTPAKDTSSWKKCTSECVPQPAWCHTDKSVGVCGLAMDGCYRVFQWPCAALQVCDQGQCVCTGAIEPACSYLSSLATSKECAPDVPTKYMKECAVGCWGEECVEAPTGEFVNIRPTGAGLEGVWVHDNGFIAVGKDRSAVHEVQGKLNGFALPGPGITLNAVSGLPSGMAFAVDRDMLFKYDGFQWSVASLTEMPPWVDADLDNLFEWKWENLAVWAVSPEEVYFGGKSGALYRFDGKTSTLLHHVHQAKKEVEIRDIWGSGPDDVYVVGAPGVALHWDGETLSPIPGLDTSVGGVGGFRAIDGLGPDDIYVLRDDSIWRRQGGQWAPMEPAPVPYDESTDFAVTEQGHIYIERGSKYQWFDGQQWHIIEHGVPDGFLVGMDAHNGRVIGVGTGGLILEIQGASSKLLTTPSVCCPKVGDQLIEDVWGTDDGAIFAVGTGGRAYRSFPNGKTEMWDLVDWVPANAFSPAVAFMSYNENMPHSIARVWASSANDAYLGSKGLVAHFDGTSWKKLNLPGLTSQTQIMAISGSGKDDVYIGGGDVGNGGNGPGFFVHWDGKEWSTVVVPGKEGWHVLAVWAEAGGDKFAVVGPLMVQMLDDGTFQDVPGQAFCAANVTASPKGTVFLGHGGHFCYTNFNDFFVRTFTGTWHKIDSGSLFVGDGIYHAHVTPKGNFLLVTRMAHSVVLDMEAVTAWSLLHPGKYELDSIYINQVIFRPVFDYGTNAHSVWVSKDGYAYTGGPFGNVVRAPLDE